MPNLTSHQVMHCFPCTGNPSDPLVDGLAGIMKVYNYALHNVDLSGPTLFAPLLRETMKVCQTAVNNGDNQYYILLLLTDGEIHDMEDTKRCII